MTKFDETSDEWLDLKYATGLDVLEHRRLVITDLLRSFDALFDGKAQTQPELFGDLRGLAHHLGGQRARGRELTYLGERGARQSTDRIHRHVAPRLHPKVRADVGKNARLESRAAQHLRYRCHSG